jgi:hypothetical protein
MKKRILERVKTFLKRWRWWVLQAILYIVSLERDNIANATLSWFGSTYGGKMKNFILSSTPKDITGWSLLILVISVVSILAYDLFDVKKMRRTNSGKQKRESQTEIRRSRFHWRAFHIEYKVNADASVVNNYLLQHYVGISIFQEIDNVFYETNAIESFGPQQHDIFQYGFIAHGIKTTPTHPSHMVAQMKITADPLIEPLPEMFVITISQGQKDVSIVSFDTDIRQLHLFQNGMLHELRKAFTVELVSW